MVQEQSEQIWCFHRYGFVRSYYYKSRMPQPLLFLALLWCLLRGQPCRKSAPRDDAFRERRRVSRAMSLATASPAAQKWS